MTTEQLTEMFLAQEAWDRPLSEESLARLAEALAKLAERLEALNELLTK